MKEGTFFHGEFTFSTSCGCADVARKKQRHLRDRFICREEMKPGGKSRALKLYR